MTDSAWPKGTGSAAARPPAPADWSRPDPPRLNDTSALVRKGIHPYELKVAAYDGPPIETPWNPEHAFGNKGGGIAISPSYGAGAFIAVKTPKVRRNGRTADGNGSIPRKGTLTTAVECCRGPDDDCM